VRFHWREVQENYDPAIGFYARRRYRRANPVFAWSPRPAQHPYIRRFSFGLNTDIFTDLQNELITRFDDVTVFLVDFHSGDNFQFHVIPYFERLEEDFPISRNITLGTGNSYHFKRYNARMSSASRRAYTLTAEYEWGTFYSGDRRDLNLGLALRPRAGWALDLSSERSDVDLAEGRFTTNVVRAVVKTQLSPWTSLVNNMQYDSVSRILGWQFRYRWITRPGSDIYFVYTHNWVDGNRFGTLDRRAATKFARTYRF
jgi:hypothetical protein